jgi:hypothetical protein
MPDLFPFPIFPVDSASVTLTTTVWIGVVVAVFFNLKLGWNLSALVVPGYLVPLILSRPTTAVVIFVEAILSYLLARWLSESLKQLPWWSSFFGRDRFFIIVVISVIVRSTCDGWLLPEFGQYIVNEMGWSFDYRNEFQSFGLIIVALIANYFWKPGLVRGILPITVCIAVAYLIIYYVLGSLTNLNLSNFELMYEDISASLLASPKSYIILICTAYLASWINLRYAWDFNGILIPALLGMMLYNPLKIVASCAECMLIFSVGSLVLRAPLFRDMGIQGGRKLLFFFTICFGLRLLYAHLIPLFSNNAQVTDVFGLGYLLSTLMAVKAHDRQLMIRMLKGTLQVSLVGGIAGCVIGFALFSWTGTFFNRSIAAVATPTQGHVRVVNHSKKTINQLIRQSKPLLYEKKESGSYQPPSYVELSMFRSALHDLKQLSSTKDSAALATISKKLARVNYALTVSANDVLFLSENQPTHGWGMFAIDLRQPEGVCFEVPTPLDEWGTFESGLALMHQLPTYVLAIAGAGRTTNIDGTSDVTVSNATMFSEFHKTFGHHQTVQIRAMTQSLWRKINKNEIQPDAVSPSQLYVASELPESIPLEQLQQIIGQFNVRWSQSPFKNKVSLSNQYAELLLTKNARRRLQVMSFSQPQTTPNPTASNPIRPVPDDVHSEEVAIVRQPLSEFLRTIKQSICKQSSNQFVPAKLEEMLFMDHEVISPLIDLVGATQPDTSLTPGGKALPNWLTREKQEKIRAIRTAANIVGYEVSVILDTENGDQYFSLSENSMSPKGWGTFILRPSLMEDLAIEIPRPLFENRSFDFGVSLFQRPRASALLIAGAHPRANDDGTADVSKAANRRNLFNLVRQVLFRKLEDRPYMLCQARAIQAPVDSDIVMASDEGETSFEQLSPLKKWLTQKLIDDEFSIGFVDGSPNTAGYELGILMKAAAIQVSMNKEIVSLWLSPALRVKYRQQNEHGTLIAQMNACNIGVTIGNLSEQVSVDAAPAWAAPLKISKQRFPIQLKSAIDSYVRNFDVIKLISIDQQFPTWTFKSVLDKVSGQTFLIVLNPNQELVAICNLTGYIGTETFRVSNLNSETVRKFINSHKLWLEVGRP